MTPNWRDHAHLVVGFERKLRNNPRWKAFFEWLDRSEGGVMFVPELLDAAESACQTFDPEKKSVLTTWMWWQFRTVFRRFVRKFEAQKTEPHALSLDVRRRTTRGKELSLGDVAATKDDDRRVDWRQPAIDPLEDVTLPDHKMQPLLYRIAWRQGTIRKKTLCADQEAPVAVTNEFVVSPHAALARRIWWRFLDRQLNEQ